MFTASEAETAYNTWGANCGPGALAAILDRPLDDVRPLLRGFDQKHYTNPRMMRAALDALGVKYTWAVRRAGYLPPLHGLARVQWTGPWMKPGVPPAAAYRHTHWVAARVVGSASAETDFERDVRHRAACPYVGNQQRARYGEPGVACTCDLLRHDVFDINCMAVGGWVEFNLWQKRVVPHILRECEPKADGDWFFTHLVELARV